MDGTTIFSHSGHTFIARRIVDYLVRLGAGADPVDAGQEVAGITLVVGRANVSVFFVEASAGTKLEVLNGQ